MTQVIHLPEEYQDAVMDAELESEGIGLARLLVMALPVSVGLWTGVAVAVIRLLR